MQFSLQYPLRRWKISNGAPLEIARKLWPVPARLPIPDGALSRLTDRGIVTAGNAVHWQCVAFSTVGSIGHWLVFTGQGSRSRCPATRQSL